MLKREIPKNHQVQAHQHKWGQFLYAQKGILSVRTKTFHYICPAEQGIWLPSSMRHEVETLTDCKVSSLYIDNDYVAPIKNIAHMLRVSPLLKMLIIEATTFPEQYIWQHMHGRHLRLVRDLIAHAPKLDTELPYPESAKLRLIAKSLYQAPNNKLSLNQWGKEVGASSRTLSRLIKKETGLTFNEWRQRLKIQIAIRQLYEGESVSNIAFNLGYETPSAFIYMFRKNMQVTPRQFLDKE